MKINTFHWKWPLKHFTKKNRKQGNHFPPRFNRKLRFIYTKCGLVLRNCNTRLNLNYCAIFHESLQYKSKKTNRPRCFLWVKKSHEKTLGSCDVTCCSYWYFGTYFEVLKTLQWPAKSNSVLDRSHGHHRQMSLFSLMILS